MKHRDRVRLSCLTHRRTTSPYSDVNAFPQLRERRYSPTRYIKTILFGMKRKHTKAMSCSLLSRPSKVRLYKRNRETRLMMASFPLPYPPSENRSKHSSAGLLLKQAFKELKSAGLLPDCLYIRLASLPSRSFS